MSHLLPVQDVEVKSTSSLEAAVKFFRAAGSKQHRQQRIRLSILKESGSFGSGTSFLDDKMLAALLRSIQRAESKGVHIVSMILDICAIEETMDPTTIEEFAQTLGCLSRFRHLIVSSNTLLRGGAHITKYLAMFLGQAKQLASLICFGIIFDGTNHDFLNLAVAISQQSILSNVRFPACVIAPRARKVSNINPFLEALMRLPKLRVLELACWGGLFPTSRGMSSSSLLPKLYGHPSLQRLHMDSSVGDWGVSSPYQHTSSFACPGTIIAISQNRSLQSLTLTLSCPREECYKLAMIIRNKKSLTSLMIDVKPWHDDRPMILITDALKTNTSLKRLSIVFGSGVTKFFSKRIQDAFLSMLDNHNQTLQYLQFTGGSSPSGGSLIHQSASSLAAVRRMQFLVKLNKLGRKELLENPNAPKSQWINTLESCRDDLDAIYFFLSMKPALCQDYGLISGGIGSRKQRKRRRLR